MNTYRFAEVLMWQVGLRVSWSLLLGPCILIHQFMEHPSWQPFLRTGIISTLTHC